MKIILYGESGVGKSSLAQNLSQIFHLQKISVGDIMRETAQNLGISIYEFDKLCSEDSKYDIEVDKKVSEIGNSQDNIILDGRLAWYFVKSGIKIKIICSYDEVLRRIAERENLDLDEVDKKTQTRQNYYKNRYAQLYPQIVYPPKDENFDIVIDTTNCSLDETTKELEEKIKQFLDK